MNRLMATVRPDQIVGHVVGALAKAREEKGLSINKLAWMSGISPKGIAFIEKGTNSPTLRNIIRIAEALDLDLTQIMSDAFKAVPK